MDETRKIGPRHNLGFEGLDFVPDGRSVPATITLAVSSGGASGSIETTLNSCPRASRTNTIRSEAQASARMIK